MIESHVESGFVPGILAVLARRGEVHIEATGHLAFEGAGAKFPMAGDTILRLGSMSKPMVAAGAMALVEDCTLRLDDPVDHLLPELADMRVFIDPGGPLGETVAAARSITLRDLLAFTLGTGIVPAEPERSPSPTPSASRRWTSGWDDSVGCPSCTSRGSAGCTTPALTWPVRSSNEPPAGRSGRCCVSGSSNRSG